MTLKKEFLDMGLSNSLAEVEKLELYDIRFKRVVEDHLPYIKSSKCFVVRIPPALGDRYNGNFYGLLAAMHVECKLHVSAFWIALRCNDYVSPYDFDNEKTTTMLIPDMMYINELLNVHRMVKK